MPWVSGRVLGAMSLTPSRAPPSDTDSPRYGLANTW